MKIGLINGSIRPRGVSGRLLEETGLLLPDEECISCQLRDTEAALLSVELLEPCDALILSFGVYVDGVPSHLLRSLVEMESGVRAWKEKPALYLIVNCGYYESSHTDLSFEIIRHWCIKTGLPFYGGIAFGSGGGYLGLRHVNMGEGEKTKLLEALKRLVTCVRERREMEIVPVDLGMSREMYFEMGNRGWHKAAKRWGVTSEELYDAPPYEGEER